MYGTIARMRVRPGAMSAALESADNEGARPDGFIGTYAYKMDDDPNELWIAVMFRDKESYMANADSPEQDARYRRLRALLLDDPEWHDGEIVHSTT